MAFVMLTMNLTVSGDDDNDGGDGDYDDYNDGSGVVTTTMIDDGNRNGE